MKISLTGLTFANLMTYGNVLSDNKLNINTGSNTMPSANSDVFLCRGEPPDKNIRKLMKMLGGVESVFGKDDPAQVME